MPSRFLSNSPSTSPSTPADLPNDAVSSSSSSSSHQDMWSYLWIPLLISLSKDLTSAKAAAHSDDILQLHSSSSVPRCPAPDAKLNYRPVIGILSHPGDGASGRLNNATNTSYIAASYVKFIESAGARVIPLIYNEPADILFEKLDLVNGVLFTGGWAKNGLYKDTVEAVFKYVLAKNDAGYHFPLYAICLGFELLTMIISKDTGILESFNAADQASTLEFMKNINIEGTVFQRFPPDLFRKLSTDCLVMQNHHFGISPQRLQENTDLSGFFKILTTSADADNKVYVSTVQAHNYPVTAFQWHPENKGFDDKPLWSHVEVVRVITGGGNRVWVCKYCSKRVTGSYSRVKAHLLKLSTQGVDHCKAITDDIHRQIKREHDEAEQRKRAKDASQKQKDDYISLPEGFDLIQPKRKKGTIDEAYNVLEREEADKECAMMFYTAMLSFNFARNPSFRRFCLRLSYVTWTLLQVSESGANPSV